jgi:hypothetical protein
MSVVVAEIGAPLPTRWTSELQAAAFEIGAPLPMRLTSVLQAAALHLLGGGSCWSLQLLVAAAHSCCCCLQLTNRHALVLELLGDDQSQRQPPASRPTTAG